MRHGEQAAVAARKPEEYGPVFADVLREPRIAPLGPSRPNAAARRTLEAMNVNDAFDCDRVTDELMARAAMAGAWLYHDYLDRSHQISQRIATPTGSYWHALMHRREPDYTNAKYWFRQAGDHPVFAALHTGAGEIAGRREEPCVADLAARPAWDPLAFVDLCEVAASEGGELEDACRHVQMREWWLLFDHCYTRALGL